jgi:hypothetical protein
MGGQWQEPRLLVRQDLGDGPIALVGMRALMRDRVAPVPKLRIQIVDIDKRARGEEGVSEVLNLALDLPLLIPATGCTRPGGEVIMAGGYASSRVARHVPRRTPWVSCAIAARTVSWWTSRAAAMVPTFQCSP